jgi:hypothetical protein
VHLRAWGFEEIRDGPDIGAFAHTVRFQRHCWSSLSFSRQLTVCICNVSVAFPTRLSTTVPRNEVYDAAPRATPSRERRLGLPSLARPIPRLERRQGQRHNQSATAATSSLLRIHTANIRQLPFGRCIEAAATATTNASTAAAAWSISLQFSHSHSIGPGRPSSKSQSGSCCQYYCCYRAYNNYY